MVDVMDCPPERLYRPDVVDHAVAHAVRARARARPGNRRRRGRTRNEDPVADGPRPRPSRSTPRPAPAASTTCTPAVARPCCCSTRRRGRGTSSATSCPLLAATHHVYAMDTLGFGDSEKPAHPMDIETCGRAVIAFADTVGPRALLARRSPHRRDHRTSRSPVGTPNGSRSSSSRAPRVPTARAAAASGRRSTRSRSPRWFAPRRAVHKRASYYPPDRPDLLDRLVLDSPEVRARARRGRP